MPRDDLVPTAPPASGFYNGAVSVTVKLPDDLAERLEAEAVRRGLSVEALAVETLEGHYRRRPTASDNLDAFIGCAASGTVEPFDIHDARAKLAERRLAEGP